MSENTIPSHYQEFVRKLFNRSKVGDLSKDYAHAILGVVTEIHELLSATDAVNALEEVGDLLFYRTALNQVAQDHAGEGFYSDGSISVWRSAMERMAAEQGLSGTIAHECNELLDEAKRWVGYDKAPRSAPATCHRVAALIKFVDSVAPYPVNNDAHAIEANMAKLLKRYPGGDFDAFRAVVRDLESERVALQTA